jgi:hypothetical protein
MTRLLLSGANPFSLENQPLGMNNYGALYNLAVLPFAAVFGNTLLTHRAVTFVFILLGFGLVFGAVLNSSRDRPLAVVTGAMVAIALAARAGLGAFPSSMGASLFLAAILVPFGRSFDRRGLLLGGLLSLLAFYTKPYFVLAFGILASYVFLFISKRKALAFALLFAVGLCASIVLVKSLYPLYFFDTVVSNLSQAARVEWGHLYVQLEEFFAEFYPVLIAVIIMLVKTSSVTPRLLVVPDLISRSNLVALDQPLVSKRPDYFAYCFMCSLLAFILILGPNPGTFMSYAYQLMLPTLVLWFSCGLKQEHRLGIIFLPVLLLNLLSFSIMALNPALLAQSDKSRQAWAALYRLVDRSGHVLNSPVLAPEMVRLGMWPPDSGHTEYYFRLGGSAENDLLGPGLEVVKSDGQDYLESIRAAVTNQEFDRIIVTDRHDYFYDYDLISRYYQQSATLSVDMPQADQKWHLIVWVPSPK